MQCMDSLPQSRSPAAVVDACWVIGICAKEDNKYAAAMAQLDAYARDGWELFAPGVLFGEVLFALCRKRSDGSLTAAQYLDAIAAFVALSNEINPPPNGDAGLFARANAILGAYGCSKASDAFYLALAEELNSDRRTELITFDGNMKNQAQASKLLSIVTVLPVLPS